LIWLDAQRGQQQTSKRSVRVCDKKKTVMPRTALRYAIEKMPDSLRIRAMEH
jgi:hypothetical protein